MWPRTRIVMIVWIQVSFQLQRTYKYQTLSFNFCVMSHLSVLNLRYKQHPVLTFSMSIPNQEMEKLVKAACSSEGIGRNPEVSDDLHQGQKEVQDSRLGYHSIGGRTNSRPPKLQGLLAVHGSTSSESLRKPMGQVGGVRTVRISPFVHTDKGIPSRVNSHATSQQCDSSFGSPENRRIPSSRLHQPSGQECDQVRGFTGESEISQVQYKHLEGQDQGLPDKAGEESLKCSRRDPNPLRRRQRQLPSDSEREEEQGTDNVNSMNPFLHSLGKEAVEPAEELETTPEEVLRKLSESLADKIFHIEKELQLLQQKHLVLWEICCAPNSTLTEEMIRNGFQSVRWNYESQFDLEKMDCVQKAIEAIPAQRPSKIWASLRCTPWISIQNLNQKTPQQVENLRKMRLRSRKQVRHVLKIFKAALEFDPQTDIYFEWPKGAKDGWSLRELADFERWVQTNLHKNLYRTQVDGCMVGLTADDKTPLYKPWIILTTDQHFDRHAAIRCDGTHTHTDFGSRHTCGCKDSFLSQQVCPTNCASLEGRSIFSRATRDHSSSSLHVTCPGVGTTTSRTRPSITGRTVPDGTEEASRGDWHEHGRPSSWTVSRWWLGYITPEDTEVYDDPSISIQEREKGRAILHRLHRSAGHPSNQSLARLLRDRKLPSWLIGEALKLQCPHCVSTEYGNKMVLNKSIGEHPRPWQIVGIDVFELAFPAQQSKTRFLLMTCLTMNFVSVAPLWTGKMSATGSDSGEKIIGAFCDFWLAHRPRPEWIMVDSQSRVWLTVISPNFYIRLGLVCWLLREKVIGFTVKQRLWWSCWRELWKEFVMNILF